MSIANDAGLTTSVWMSCEVPDFPVLADQERDPEICVVGAGIAGLSIARALALRGHDVLVLDRGPVGGGQTARTSAHLSSALDDRYYLLRKHFGAEGARLAAASHRAAIDEIERTVKELAIACEFARVPGYLFGDEAVLARELPAATEAGLEAAFVDHAPLPFETGRALRFEHQAELQPLAYIAALARDLQARGVRIRTNTHVLEVTGGELCEIKVQGDRTLRAKAVVDATGFGITSRFDIPIRMAAYRSYCLAFTIPHDAIPHGLYWDTSDPYHYIRLASDAAGDDVLVVGGEDHRVGQGDPDQAWAALEAWTKQRFPMVGDKVAHWSGQIGEPSDGLAYIGALPGAHNVFMVTGDSGNGLTHGVIAGMIIPALIAHEAHPWAELYSIGRSKLHGIGTLVHEAIKSNIPFRDWISPADVSSVDDIKPGHGATVRRGLHLVAAYRDSAGICHERSARCPHLNAVVRWNAAEQTWDCPAHGSRFDGCGRVLNGPSARDLSELDT
jgi:glycine/D-amino acid oxidase-like deaminating enzyme/nitrite reductase/ring-hydroxylating ferredoxin subunit